MSIKAVLFDLDGTLLPMDQELFIKAYFGGLCRRLAPLGHTPDDVVKALWRGISDMTKNVGDRRNEEVFWDAFASVLGADILHTEDIFDAFYREEFPVICQETCGRDARARTVIDTVKEKGLTPILATNPVFPSVATECRIRRAGLEPSDFALYTVFENSRRCKPNLDYYRDILSACALDASECVMVGNDVDEDMIASTLGMRVFLLTPCLINRHGADISRYPNGGFDELIDFIKSL